MLHLDASADASLEVSTLYAQTTPPVKGEYVIIIDYVNPVDRHQQLKVNVNYQIGLLILKKFKIYWSF